MTGAQKGMRSAAVSLPHWPGTCLCGRVLSPVVLFQKRFSMKLSFLMTAVAVVATTATGAQAADTLAKIAAANKMTVAYRESSVPFSYLDGPEKPIGFSVDLTNAIVAAVKAKLGKPGLEVAQMAVTSQNRIPLITNGT